jgi:hypothetical protein
VQIQLPPPGALLRDDFVISQVFDDDQVAAIRWRLTAAGARARNAFASGQLASATTSTPWRWAQTSGGEIARTTFRLHLNPVWR